MIPVHSRPEERQEEIRDVVERLDGCSLLCIHTVAHRRVDQTKEAISISKVMKRNVAKDTQNKER